MNEFFSIYPKVYSAEKTERLTILLDKQYVQNNESVSVKIQGMEHYGIEHSRMYRIDEEDRYPYLPMEKIGENAYALDYHFTHEQKYSVRIKINGKALPYTAHVYAVKEDLVGLQPMKCDTHLHSCRSDGEGTPFEVGIAYRAAGYDFIAITDHHKMYPSVEGKEAFRKLTDKFFVIRAEEVHNKDMGYFHVINLGGSFSVNEVIEAEDGYAESEVARLLADGSFPDGTTPYICAYRTFISEQIRKGGGIAVMAHPFWDCYGEYNMPAADVFHLLRTGCYDAYELLAGCDNNNNGNNIQLALWQELLAEGVRVPVLGASDAHSTKDALSLFNKQFSIVFARCESDALSAIKDGRTVAVLRENDEDFLVFGSYRLTKYARFLLDEYFPAYVSLTEKHARALECGDMNEIKAAEAEIDKYKKKVFG